MIMTLNFLLNFSLMDMLSKIDTLCLIVICLKKKTMSAQRIQNKVTCDRGTWGGLIGHLWVSNAITFILVSHKN